MLFWNRPQPRFRISDLLFLSGENVAERLLLVKYVRWTRLNDESNKQWVYDGVVIAVRGNRVIIETPASQAYPNKTCAGGGNPWKTGFTTA